AVAALLDERVRPAARVGVEAREVERAAEVAAIKKTAPAPVRQLEAGLDQVVPRRPRQAFVEIHVPFGPHEIALPAAAGDRARPLDCGSDPWITPASPIACTNAC